MPRRPSDTPMARIGVSLPQELKEWLDQRLGVGGNKSRGHYSQFLTRIITEARRRIEEEERQKQQPDN